MPRVAALLFVAPLLCACIAASDEDSRDRAELEATDDDSLGATLDDPIYTTVTAAPERSNYFVDEGYTFVRDEDGTPVFRTDDAGDLAIFFVIDGRAIVREDEHSRRVEITHTQRDAIVTRFRPTRDVEARVTFGALTSRGAALEVDAWSVDGAAHDVRVLAMWRRCGGALFPRVQADGVRAEHIVPPHVGRSVETILGTFATAKPHVLDRSDLFVAERAAHVSMVTVCARSFADDARRLERGGDDFGRAMPALAAVALDVPLDLASQRRASVRFERIVADASAERGADGAKTESLERELARSRAVSLSRTVAAGRRRLRGMPVPPGLDREQELVLRSSFLLVDGLVLRAPTDEGGWIAKNAKLRRPHLLFGREPSWNFSDLGMNLHESLATPFWARLDPQAAVLTQRNFLDVERDGFVPYSAGAVVQQSWGGTLAGAPLFSFEANALADAAERAGDVQFVADAFAAGGRIHRFWTERRDRNGNGLVEWGEPGPGSLGGLSGAQAESLRDVDNVIWDQVIAGGRGGVAGKLATLSAPMEVDALDASTMLVVEERSLAALGQRLGRRDDAARFTALAKERASLINEALWDDETGFYYHAAKAKNVRRGYTPSDRFTYRTTNDLVRAEIQGFLPLWAGIVPPDRISRVIAHLTDPHEFWRPNGIPSLAANDPFYRAESRDCCLWNGPVWIPWNWLVVQGLKSIGRGDLARELTARVTRTVAAELRRSHQFREHYDPDDTARPNHSMGNYIWSALVGEMIFETH